MTWSKRLFDLTFALLLIIVLFPALIIIAALILILDGRPVFFLSERMHSHQTGFQLIKFRTMTTVSEDSGVSGGDKENRVTRTGQFLRRTRLDETPQLWNILKGEMSFVGPRPPLRQYVEMFPNRYKQVLKSRPGVAGQATLTFHRHEERLLRVCKNSEETHQVYVQRCIPRKIKLDLIYQKNRSLCMDASILLRTFTDRLSG